MSAEAIVPHVIRLTQPGSVVDVGCGTGTWLSVFKRHGIEEICGIDGDYVERTNLEIPSKCFIAADLKQSVSMSQKFDLVVSIEVAEHIPPQNANVYIESLVGLGPVILFSAAIPFQGGIEHVNEQWPDYWIDC